MYGHWADPIVNFLLFLALVAKFIILTSSHQGALIGSDLSSRFKLPSIVCLIPFRSKQRSGYTLTSSGSLKYINPKTINTG